MPVPCFCRLPALLLASALGLGACTTEDGPAGLALVAAPQIDPPETIYRSSMDGPHPISAVPLEKLPETYRRQTVAYDGDEAPGTIIIHPGEKLLYFVTGPRTAIRYGISVGRAGFEWAGEAVVTQTRPWPTWTPPPEMIERDPKLAKWEKGQPGGPTNPLGARAIYLTTNGRDYGYRIHGTPDWWSIGRNASSGCIRMINQDVLDLSQRVQPGAKVIVLKADGSRASRLIVPPPAPPKKPKAVEAVAAVEPPTVIPAAATVADPDTITPAVSLPAPPEAAPAISPATISPRGAVPGPGVITPTRAAPPVIAPVATLPQTPDLPIPPAAASTVPATP